MIKRKGAEKRIKSRRVENFFVKRQGHVIMIEVRYVSCGVFRAM